MTPYQRSAGPWFLAYHGPKVGPPGLWVMRPADRRPRLQLHPLPAVRRNVRRKLAAAAVVRRVPFAALVRPRHR